MPLDIDTVGLQECVREQIECVASGTLYWLQRSATTPEPSNPFAPDAAATADFEIDYVAPFMSFKQLTGREVRSLFGEQDRTIYRCKIATPEDSTIRDRIVPERWVALDYGNGHQWIEGKTVRVNKQRLSSIIEVWIDSDIELPIGRSRIEVLIGALP